MADGSREPLVSHDLAEGESDGGGAGHDADDEATIHSQVSYASTLQGQHAQRPTFFLWLLTLSAGLSGLLFGYDTGVISATLVSIGSALSDRPLTILDKSLITASTSLFALLVSPVTGLLGDTLGRKRVILFADVAFIVGALTQALATEVWTMVIGRSVVGLAVGAASFVTPLYIAELSPSEYRGRLVTMSVVLITFGQVVAYLAGWIFTEVGGENGWRWLVGLGALPAGLQYFLMLLMPESPRWLVKMGEWDKAEHVLRSVFGKSPHASKLVHLISRQIEKEVRVEEAARRDRARQLSTKSGTGYWAQLAVSARELFRIPSNRRALAIACLLQGLQQLCGFNSLMYFSATLFSLAGFSTPTLTSLSVAVTNLLFTLVSLLLIDVVGRRRILLLSVPVMILALASCAIAFPPVTSLDAPSNPEAMRKSSVHVYSSLVAVASIILYVAAYATGLGNVPWQQSELFPLSVRSLGSSISTATNWGANFVVGVTFLGMLKTFGPVWSFGIYAVVCGVGWLAIWRMYPETKGLSLEETGELLRDGWGVR